MSTLSPVEVSQRLADRFTLLTSGARTAEARQQTLRATVDWSYQLLSETEQRVFDRLSVFQGGWTLMSAEDVVGDEEHLPARSSTPSAGSSNGPWSSSNPAPPPGTGCWRRCGSTPPNGSGVRPGGRGGAPPRRLLQQHRRARRSRVAWARAAADAAAAARRATQHPRRPLSFLSGPDGDRDAALTMAGSSACSGTSAATSKAAKCCPDWLPGTRGHWRRGRWRCKQSPSSNGRGCLVHPSPRCAEAASESLALFEELGDTWHAALSRVLLAVEGVTGAEPERSQALLAAAEEQFNRDGDPWGRGHRVRPDGDRRDQDR